MTLGEYLEHTGWFGALALAALPIAAYQVLSWLADWLYPMDRK